MASISAVVVKQLCGLLRLWRLKLGVQGGSGEWRRLWEGSCRLWMTCFSSLALKILFAGFSVSEQRCMHAYCASHTLPRHPMLHTSLLLAKPPHMRLLRSNRNLLVCRMPHVPAKHWGRGLLFPNIHCCYILPTSSTSLPRNSICTFSMEGRKGTTEQEGGPRGKEK